MKKKKSKKKDWELKDFVKSVDTVMQRQEQENPELKQVHARLSPEWKTVSEKLARLLSLRDEIELAKLREEIVAAGETATRVLIDFLMKLVQSSEQTGEKK